MQEKFNKGLKYVDKNPQKAISIFKEFIRDHECKEAWLNIGVAYKNADKYSLAGEAFLKAADSGMPFSDGTFVKTYPTALSNLGLIADSFGQYKEAEQFFRTALTADPLYYDCIWNLSVCKLRSYCSDRPENLTELWKLYAYRFKRLGAEPLKNSRKDLVMWDGISKVKSIVVLAEQGIGDSIMFGRYLELLEAYASEIWIQCDPTMNELFSKYKTCVDTLECTATHGYPLGSLGMLSNGIPEGEWLAGKRVAKVADGKLDIGCVWAGNSGHVNNRNRSTNAFFFNKLRKYGNLHTIGPGAPTEGFNHLQCSDWSDTIRQLGKLDLVIAVDTSIVHLCGSLGMPCWVMMPLHDSDFRWGDDSMGFNNIWYPSVSVVRNPNSWIKTFETVTEMLDEIS